MKLELTNLTIQALDDSPTRLFKDSSPINP